MRVDLKSHASTRLHGIPWFVWVGAVFLMGCGGSSPTENSPPQTATPTTPRTPTAPVVAVSPVPPVIVSPVPPTIVESDPVSANVPAGYTLVWSDEFSSTTEQLPNAGKWRYDTHRNRLGWYNNEQQYYASGRLENSKAAGGNLVITARKENLSSAADWGGQRYTSTRLFTKGTASWTYGFFEIRAKLPCGAGTWPAIWTLGDWTDVWPLQGEIDIMEQTGWDKSKVLATVHTQSGSGGNGSTGSTTVADACGSFHNYQMTWTPQQINFAVDGKVFRSAYNNPGTGNNAWPFDKPQHLLINLAIGGTLGGTIDDKIFPVVFEIDYVRVYQKL